MEESSLRGGFVTEVVRVGDTVRRSPGPNAAFVRELLTLFERCGWPGAPRFLGVDDRGRETMSFLDGHVAWAEDQPPAVYADGSLAELAELVREFHDLTAATELAANAEVVCHNDLSPKNTVYRDLDDGLRPYAFIDWDIAAPGARVHDVAHICWQFVGLGPGLSDVAAASRVRLICDAYGLDDRSHVVETILWWQDRCWRGIETEAAAGDEAKIALRDSGVCAAIRAAHEWLAAHRRTFEIALR
ncbi:MAG: phosphotransferase [Streptosporangiales bacterium]|nr:phosphotransferase [Streptosporangiales bacterium]